MRAGVRQQLKKAARAWLLGRTCLRCRSAGPLDVHHWAGRGTDSLKLNSLLWQALCRPCHDWVGRERKAAREAGFLCPMGCWNDERRALVAIEKNVLRPEGGESKVDV